jgi:biopolymer transport protein ExbB
MTRARSAVLAVLAAALAGWGLGAAAQNTSPAVDATVQANRSAVAAQQQIDQLDDQTRALLEKYRAALWQTQQLNVYVQQIGPLLATQDADRANLQQQLQQFNGSSHDLTPLLLRMIDSLDKFVALDLPFLQQERRERIASLKRLMTDAATPQAEKYRRVLEAYKVEGDYGSSLGIERMQLQADGGKTVDVLRLGRVALYYLTLDGHEAAIWDPEGKQWRLLQGGYRSAVRDGLKIALERAAPEVLVLPVPAVAGGQKQSSLDRAAAFRLALGRVGSVLLDALAPPAEAAPTDELLKQIRDAAAQNARIDQERIQRFIRNKAEQQAQLAEAEGQQRAAQAKADSIRARYDGNQKAIAELKNQLTTQSGDLGQAYAAVREAAAQFRNSANESYISAQFPERLKLLETLADPNTLPSGKQLEDFWFTLQQEITENGKVAGFEAEVIGTDGTPSRMQVTRVGGFVAFAGGRYLVVQPGAHLQVAERQTLDTGLARAFESASGWAPLPVDPSHGVLLKLAAERPTLMERIEQGRLVGTIIIVVGLVGAALAVFQLVYLFLVGNRISRQLKNLGSPSADNPLGRVLSCLKDDTAAHDPEVLETRISEAVLRETPKLERFQPFLRMVVAAGPLLGLLGTVTGMIITFQVITEIGAGDPKVMAGGISQAMISTVLGLIIAIPILFINSVLAARSRVLVQILDEQSAGLLAARLEQQHNVR